ncbi:Cytochrome c biogenesis ATP-binding export protein CcmA [Oligella urethralis]|uniref:cytochrome c biogenesis heme-transporting ATPase CcmA n=1 Tax=Oligella urethralis TaxID=90245 RepID=UPI000DFFF4FF|nr:cytochrome c biogenesis heme-transporting ATPase CcmA [Oligella urethralis]SUA59831.1 Cytochrome c biogenesis ATP-binding export protein CcmA [Oligella urethralis]
MLEVSNLDCVRGERRLFHDVSFLLRSGEGLLITGENGSGKTSLLRMLVGLTPPFIGTINWKTRLIKHLGAEYRRELLYCGHPLGLKDSLSATENLQSIASLVNEPVELSVVQDALERIGLQGSAHMPVRALSQGQKRRVSLARLFLSRRTLWVLDEPLTALDTKASQHVAQAVDRHLDDGGIAVITTHQDMALASPLQTELPAPSWPLSPNYFRYNFGAYGACCGNWAVGSLCYLAA